MQAESYLAILTRQSMLMQNKGKYIVTAKGQSYISFLTEFEKSKPKKLLAQVLLHRIKIGSSKNLPNFF